MKFTIVQESNKRLRIVFEDHRDSPVSCTTSNTPELIGLKQLLDQTFPGTNYVLRNGGDCELAPNVPFTSEDNDRAALQIKAQVIELLQHLGHEFEETSEPSPLIELIANVEQGDLDAIARLLNLCVLQLQHLRKPNSNSDTIREGIAGDLELAARSLKAAK